MYDLASAFAPQPTDPQAQAGQSLTGDPGGVMTRLASSFLQNYQQQQPQVTGPFQAPATGGPVNAAGPGGPVGLAQLFG